MGKHCKHCKRAGREGVLWWHVMHIWCQARHKCWGCARAALQQSKHGQHEYVGPCNSGTWQPAVWQPAVWQPAVWQPAEWQPAAWQPAVWQCLLRGSLLCGSLLCGSLLRGCCAPAVPRQHQCGMQRCACVH